MYNQDGDPIGKPRMIHRQNPYDSVVLTGYRRHAWVNNETLYDSVVLTKDTESYEVCRLMVTDEKTEIKLNSMS